MEYKNRSVGTYPINKQILRSKSNALQRTSRYNYLEMKEYTTSVHLGFTRNLSELRTKKGISAREMSLSLGQNSSYINDIENGRALPSLAMFFEICEYLKITPPEFFGYALGIDRDLLSELVKTAERLTKDDLMLLIKIAERMQQEGK